MKCDICLRECDGKNVIVDIYIVPDLVVCNECLNEYANQEFDKLTTKLEKRDDIQSKTCPRNNE